MVNRRMFALLVGASGTLSDKLPEFCMRRACAAVVALGQCLLPQQQTQRVWICGVLL